MLVVEWRNIVATKKAVKKLEFIPVTVYIKPEDHEWFKKHADQLSSQEGQPVSMTNVVRRALVEYRKKLEKA
jgi:hypothetical protein